MIKWTEDMVPLAIRADVYGPLAVHCTVQDSEIGYGVTHIGSGYSLTKVFAAADMDIEDLDEVKYNVQVLVDAIPKIDELLHEVHSGATKERRGEIGRMLLVELQVAPPKTSVKVIDE